MPKVITLSEMKSYVSENITASRQLFESSSLSLENYQYQPYTFVSYSCQTKC